MKKILILAMCLVACHTLSAQSWMDALKKAATEAADKATGGKVTEMALVGNWSYSGPAVRMNSDNTIAQIGSSALMGTVEGKLKSAYQLVGIKPGTCRFTFDNAGKFSALMGSRTLKGSYTFDTGSHALTLRFDSIIGQLASLTGHAYLSGSDMQMVFPSEKLLQLITALGEKVPTLSTATKALAGYKDVALGFKFSK